MTLQSLAVESGGEGVLLKSVPPCVNVTALKVCNGVCNQNLDR
jgi:hypothetical protein